MVAKKILSGSVRDFVSSFYLLIVKLSRVAF